MRNEIDRAWRLANPNRVREADRQKYLRNPGKHNLKVARWCQKHPERRKSHNSTWKLRNPDKINSDAARRRSAKRLRIPPWADFEKIKLIYQECKRREIETGIPHHVDHIVPLNGKNVSGLHWEGNLQILTGVENMKKSNRFNPYPVSKEPTK